MTFIILLGIIGAFYAVYRAVSIFWKITEKDRISKTFLAVIVLHSAFIVGIVIFFLAFNFDYFARDGISVFISESIGVLLICCHSILVIAVATFLNLKGAVRRLAVVFSFAYSILVTYGFVGLALLSAPSGKWV
jgi:uncharacterized membrane protein YidH (DUF202 family)